jgi:GPH family glycoside/pentoside/hexuronide:cation symporter
VIILTENDDIEITHGKGTVVSYGIAHLSREFLLMAFNTFVFFYYEVEVGLNVWYIGIGLIIFAVYNAMNDPIVGYLTNRPFKFTKKWGRRFPWIILGGIPMGFCYFLIFIPPNVDPQTDIGALILFGWFVFVTCLFDTLHTIFFVSFQALFPDKFRTQSERRTSTAYNVMLGVVGVALGAMIPPLLITFGNLQSYVIQGLFVFLFSLITIIIAIPGYRDDQPTVDRYLETYVKETKRISFITELKLVFKQKSFVAFIIIYMMYQTLVVSMTGSIPYVVRFILKMPASATTLMMAALLIGVIVSTPFWAKLAQKTNDNRKVMLISAILLGVFLIPMIFNRNYEFMLINLIIWGIALGGYWCMIFPVMSDVIDESVVRNEDRKEGTITGIQQFFGRLGIIIQALSFAVAHSLTGFVEGAETQSESALWGIHIHLAVVPMIGILFGAFVFWKWYDLKPDKINENKIRIKQLKL